MNTVHLWLMLFTLFLFAAAFDGLQREDVRHGGAVGLVRSALRLTIFAMAPVEEDARRLVAEAADVIPAEGAVQCAAAFAVPAEASAADVANIVFTRSARLGAFGDALRI